MNSKLSQVEKARQLRQLHHGGKLLILPNVWDVLGAKLLEDLGYPTIATASASVAITNGYDDGEKIPFEDVLQNLQKIASRVNVPVTADVETAYTNNDVQLQENIKRIIETGVVGINFEDTNLATHTLNETEEQCRRIRVIRKTADAMGVPLFINARTDVMIHAKPLSSPEAIQAELVNRGLAYKEVGADCFFPVLIKSKDAIHDLVTKVQMPVNIVTVPGIPDLEELEEMGVARLSLGPSFLRIAINAMKNLAEDLKEQNGLSTVLENQTTTDYLKSLIKN